MKQLYDEYEVDYELSPKFSGCRITTYECDDTSGFDRHYELYVHYSTSEGGDGLFYKCYNPPSKEEAIFQLVQHRNKAGTEVKRIFGNLFGS